jgi:hypothetical protein
MRQDERSIIDNASGIQSWRKKVYLNAALGAGDGTSFDSAHKTFAAAYADIETLKKDCIVLEESGSSISLAANPLWTKSLCGLIGTSHGKFNHRSRIGMSTAFSPMITVSGYGNYFANIYTMHGTAAADYTGWYVTGDRNVFENVHFGGPMNADQGGHASYIGNYFTGSEGYYKSCVFGTHTIDRDELAPTLKLGPGVHVFEDCIFTMSIGADTDPYHVLFDNTSGSTEVWFKNCQFHAFGVNSLTKAAVCFTFSAGYSADVIIDSQCSFSGFTSIAASASLKYIWMPTAGPDVADDKTSVMINTATY